MIMYKTIGQWEKLNPFVNAVVSKDILNGAIGNVENGVFTVAANGAYAVMAVEVGDDMNMDEYKITAGTPVRVLDLSKIDGQTVQIYGAQLPATFSVKDKLASDESGKLVTGGSTAPYFEVTKIVGNNIGVEATVVAQNA